MLEAKPCQETGNFQDIGELERAAAVTFCGGQLFLSVKRVHHIYAGKAKRDSGQPRGTRFPPNSTNRFDGDGAYPNHFLPSPPPAA
jgi:hypothetical protein